jgi:hypothetical protein
VSRPTSKQANYSAGPGGVVIVETNRGNAVTSLARVTIKPYTAGDPFSVSVYCPSPSALIFAEDCCDDDSEPQDFADLANLLEDLYGSGVPDNVLSALRSVVK